MHCVPTAFGIFLGAAALKFGAPDLQDQVSLEKFLEARRPGAKKRIPRVMSCSFQVVSAKLQLGCERGVPSSSTGQHLDSFWSYSISFIAAKYFNYN